MATPPAHLSPNINDTITHLLNIYNTPSDAITSLHALLSLSLTSYSSIRAALKARISSTASAHQHTITNLFHAAAVARAISSVRRSYPRSLSTRKLIEALGEETWRDLVDWRRLAEVVELEGLARRHKDVLCGLVAGLGGEGFKGYEVVGALVGNMLIKEIEEEEACEELLTVEKGNREVAIEWLGGCKVKNI